MTTKSLAISALVLAAAIGVSGPAFAGDRHHKRPVEQERYVPAEGDLIDVLFGGPRYYDAMLVTTAAGCLLLSPDGAGRECVEQDQRPSLRKIAAARDARSSRAPVVDKPFCSLFRER
ncbi:hypothetical protein [Mesorhizobium sp.]|uniref:hypothetical protein n=1 Tax=Mesorhizobium sp. TaxID=1871066 RepID=UPI0034585917